AYLPGGVWVFRAILHVNHTDQPSATDYRHRQKSLEAVLRYLVEQFEARVLKGASRHRDRLPVFGHPTGDALPQLEFQAIDQFRMGVLGSPQDQFVVFEQISEA